MSEHALLDRLIRGSLDWGGYIEELVYREPRPRPELVVSPATRNGSEVFEDAVDPVEPRRRQRRLTVRCLCDRALPQLWRLHFDLDREWFCIKCGRSMGRYERR